MLSLTPKTQLKHGALTVPKTPQTQNAVNICLLIKLLNILTSIPIVTCCDSVNVVAGASTSLSSQFTGTFTANTELTASAGSTAKVYKRGTGDNSNSICLWMVAASKNWAIGGCASAGQNSAYVHILIPLHTDTFLYFCSGTPSRTVLHCPLLKSSLLPLVLPMDYSGNMLAQERLLLWMLYALKVW